MLDDAASSSYFQPGTFVLMHNILAQEYHTMKESMLCPACLLLRTSSAECLFHAGNVNACNELIVSSPDQTAHEMLINLGT